MKNLLLLFVGFIILACNKDEPEVQTTFSPITITPQLIGKENLNGSEGILEQKIIINNETSWNNLKNQIDNQYIQIDLGNYYTENNFEETTIDFNIFTVIAVFDQVYENGGHSIDVTNITEYENNIVVNVENILSGNISTSMTQPFHIVKIPKTTKPILFE